RPSSDPEASCVRAPKPSHPPRHPADHCHLPWSPSSLVLFFSGVWRSHPQTPDYTRIPVYMTTAYFVFTLSSSSMMSLTSQYSQVPLVASSMGIVRTRPMKAQYAASPRTM